MRIHLDQTIAAHKSRRLSRQALTLVEMMITMAIFALVVAAFTTLQIFGLKQNQLVESKLGANDQARINFEKMTREIRSAKQWNIGNVSGTNNTYTRVADNTQQKGTALQIHLTTNTNDYIRYFFATNIGTLYRLQSGYPAKKVAEDLTNNMSFRVEDFQGVIQSTNNLWRSVICVMFEFKQYQYPLTKVGPGYLYDYYKMEYKVTPHAPSLY